MTWEVQRVAAVEDAIHSTLEARGSKRHAPGTEWFDTTVEEVESIVKFVQPMAQAVPRQEGTTKKTPTSKDWGSSDRLG